MLRATIFDFNGVLVDDEGLHFALFREVLAGVGVGLTDRAYHEEYLGYDDRGCFSAALAAAGRPVDDRGIARLIDIKARRYVEEAANGLRVFAGAADAVRSLADVGPLAICSGALRGEIELALGLMGVRDHVAAIVSAEDTTRCKPDPEGYLLALDMIRSLADRSLAAEHCLAIEDSLAGIAAARAAGLSVVAVANTYPAADLLQAGAAEVLDSLESVTPSWVASRFVR